MIKECGVVMHNHSVAVAMYDDVKVQVPASMVVGKSAFIKHEDGKYFTVTKENYENSLKAKLEKKTKKTKAVEDVAESVENIVIDNEDNIE